MSGPSGRANPCASTDAFEPHLASVAEDDLAIVAFHMLIEANAGSSLGDDGDERGLADLQRVAAQIVAVHLDQVEGVEEHGAVVTAIADAIELGDAAVVARDRLAVDDAGAGA